MRNPNVLDMRMFYCSLNSKLINYLVSKKNKKMNINRLFMKLKN